MLQIEHRLPCIQSELLYFQTRLKYTFDHLIILDSSLKIENNLLENPLSEIPFESFCQSSVYFNIQNSF